MKDAPYIWEVWDTNKYLVGDDRPHSRVTVEPDWQLNLTEPVIGTDRRGPYRWFQREDNGQTEVELPNVLSIRIDESLETDAAVLELELANQNIDLEDISYVQGQFGRPGYYTFNYGESEEAKARWGQEVNEWNNVIVPNCLIRTFEGFGGHEKTIAEAVEDGNLVLTGVWLVDTVTITSTGIINVSCRNMAKLLIEQSAYIPLIPREEYPLRYKRWIYRDSNADFDPRPPQLPPGGPAQEIPLGYLTSSGDKWYGQDASIHGHRPTHSIDGNLDSFALSVGNSHPSRPFTTDYFEYKPWGQIDWLYVYPWGGNYSMYVSIKENGVWLDGGGGLIPYDHSPLCSSQRCVDTGADIPFVMSTGIPWEEGHWYRLPRVYNAEAIRITFKNHTQSPWGPWHYRCGIREVKVGYGANERPDGEATEPWVYSIDAHPTGEGYVCCDEAGKIFAFGDADIFAETSPRPHEAYSTSIRYNSEGTGYWVLDRNGRVHTYGDVQHFGDEIIEDYTSWRDICPTHDDQGYWLVNISGGISAFGNAYDYGAAPQVGSNGIHASTAAAHGSALGLWVCSGDGEVTAYGAAVDYGSIVNRAGMDADETIWRIKPTHTNNGYWLIGNKGHLFAFGDAVDYPDPALDGAYRDLNTIQGTRRLCTDLAVSSSGAGIWVQMVDGTIKAYGTAEYFGQPGGMAKLRYPGNYEDYSDIVRDFLLWSGWTFFDEGMYSAEENAPVFGSIETTGAFADDDISEDTFDKKPIIDCINILKEIVGYIFYIDSDGSAVFRSPNWWGVGNFYENGQSTSYIPEIDESKTLTDYSISYSDENARSEIIISTLAPEADLRDTLTTKLIPTTNNVLRGIVKPAIWTNEVFTDPDEQRIMAELIAMHIWFSMRVGSVSCVANPAIRLDDQIRIFERNTSESYIHYVRSISRYHNRVTGEYTMNIETHWLGTEDNWVITADNILPDDQKIQVSQNLVQWMKRGATEARFRQIVDNNSAVYPASFATTGEISDGAPGAADG